MKGLEEISFNVTCSGCGKDFPHVLKSADYGRKRFPSRINIKVLLRKGNLPETVEVVCPECSATTVLDIDDSEQRVVFKKRIGKKKKVPSLLRRKHRVKG